MGIVKSTKSPFVVVALSYKGHPLIDKNGVIPFANFKINLSFANFSVSSCAYRLFFLNEDILLLLSTKIIRYCPVKGTLSFALYAFDFTLVTIPVLMSFSTHSPLCFETSSILKSADILRRTALIGTDISQFSTMISCHPPAPSPPPICS